MFWKTFPGENNTDMQPLNALKPIRKLSSFTVLCIMEERNPKWFHGLFQNYDQGDTGVLF